MRRQRLAWAALLGAPTALELWAVATGRTHWTLSPQLRWALRCNTTTGQAATTLLVGAGGAWLAHHLMTIPPAEAGVGGFSGRTAHRTPEGERCGWL